MGAIVYYSRALFVFAPWRERRLNKETHFSQRRKDAK